ncbi:MAG: serine hydrolase [Paludibacter sp.]|nr:serine hydrolase [Paludibacter sp.]
MKKSLLFLWLAAFPFHTCISQNTHAQSFMYNKKIPDTFDAKRLSRIDSIFQQLVDNGTIPHAVTFVAQHGKVIHHKVYGWRDIEAQIPCLKSDIFRMASQTKAITATAALILMEEGKIQLDEPAKKYIPEFGHPQVLTSFNPEDSSFTSRPAKRDITIRDLMTIQQKFLMETI